MGVISIDLSGCMAKEDINAILLEGKQTESKDRVFLPSKRVSNNETVMSRHKVALRKHQVSTAKEKEFTYSSDDISRTRTDSIQYAACIRPCSGRAGTGSSPNLPPKAILSNVVLSSFRDKEVLLPLLVGLFGAASGMPSAPLMRDAIVVVDESDGAIPVSAGMEGMSDESKCSRGVSRERDPGDIE